MSEEFDHAFWEERYRGHTATERREPNPHLVTAAADLPPGTALDAGCGTGADASWLAARGWQVTAVDISGTALRRAREYAGTLGAEVAGRVEWVHADLTGWTPGTRRFDLVTSHYVHAAVSHGTLFRRLAGSVAPGGTLLIVGHQPTGHPAEGPNAPPPAAHASAGEIAAVLDPHGWAVTVAEARPRSGTDHDGREITSWDAVVLARRLG